MSKNGIDLQYIYRNPGLAGLAPYLEEKLGIPDVVYNGSGSPVAERFEEDAGRLHKQLSEAVAGFCSRFGDDAVEASNAFMTAALCPFTRPSKNLVFPEIKDFTRLFKSVDIRLLSAGAHASRLSSLDNVFIQRDEVKVKIVRVATGPRVRREQRLVFYFGQPSAKLAGWLKDKQRGVVDLHVMGRWAAVIFSGQGQAYTLAHVPLATIEWGDSDAISQVDQDGRTI
jgi:hypothetical protein